jgi:hypothetical protein
MQLVLFSVSYGVVAVGHSLAFSSVILKIISILFANVTFAVLPLAGGVRGGVKFVLNLNVAVASVLL